ECPVVMSDEARLDLEALPELQRLAERDRLAGDDGVPAATLHRVEQPRADEQVPAPEVEQREVAAVVHVAEDVEVRRQGGEADPTDPRGVQPSPAAQPQAS